MRSRHYHLRSRHYGTFNPIKARVVARHLTAALMDAAPSGRGDRAARFGYKVGQISPTLDKVGTFSDQISVYFD